MEQIADNKVQRKAPTFFFSSIVNKRAFGYHSFFRLWRGTERDDLKMDDSIFSGSSCLTTSRNFGARVMPSHEYVRGGEEVDE